MAYMLVIFLAAGYGSAIDHVRFIDKESCIAAAEQINKPNDFGTIRAVCLYGGIS